VNSIPTKDAIEGGCEDKTLQVCLLSQESEERLRSSLSEIPELARLDISFLDDTVSEENRNAPSGTTLEPLTQEKSRKNGQTASQTAQTVRVDVKLLDALMNNVGEMVIERNKIRQSIRQLEAQYESNETFASLRDTSARIIKLVSELQENVLQARMLPIGTVFNGFPRLVRDTSQKMNKKVELITDGQETELDRTILEQIRDPLVHLLRNAIDHGIEKPEVRLAAGKQEKGVILLSAYQEQNYIIIVVEDDGHGIDIQKVKRKSIEQGLLTQEDAERMSDEDAMRLIFYSGMSTAQEVTEVSGRGVGMDVVHTNIESVGGAVSIESKLGEGTRFTIRLPLTLAT
ncbi:MAG: chemotaxis protein CheA, partial [Candidatus Altiarchaeota archaeon]|nr:chemotaxis protein CheA [Candidatus Altiarchaeota archaeon]